MGGWVVRDIALMETEVAAAQALEIRHARVIECGIPIAVFVRDDVFAGRGVVALFTGGNLGVENFVAGGVVNSRALFRQADLDPAFLSQGIPTEEESHHPHVVAAGGEIDRPDVGGTRPDLGLGTRPDQGAGGPDGAGVRGKHQRSDSTIVFQHPAQDAGADALEKRVGNRQVERRVRVRALVEQLPDGERATAGNREMERRLALGQAEAHVRAIPQEKRGDLVLFQPDGGGQRRVL